ncbi:MAG: ROK family protein [Acidobacteria bacterium]|nr:ROK family protein [Acidobacteriota bacterium]
MTRTTDVIGAVDVGGTKIAVGLVGDRGDVLSRVDLPTEPGRSFDDAMNRVIDALSGCLRHVRCALRGIGIGATGPIDHVTGAFGSVPFFPHWQGGNPAASLAGAFGVTVAVENDADAAALGEAEWGVGRGARRFIFVTVGTGIGGGIVIDGRLYRGAGGTHPELGHIVIEASGSPCTCGGRGCWEALAAGPAIAERYAAHARVSRVPAIAAHEVCALAREGDAVARDAVVREARYLGVGLATLITTFAPDVVALGGSVMGSYDLFEDVMRAAVREHCVLVPFTEDTIRTASLGADAGLVGAAQVWRHRFEEGHRNA